MSSFDVKSLFTNIPLNETLDIIIYELFDNQENESRILLNHKDEKVLECLSDSGELVYFDRTSFRKLLELATLESYFFFNGDIYQQIDGVAMGSPLGPTLANIFMSHMEKKWLRDCPVDFKPVLYRRYVDDSFLLFTSDTHMDLFLNYLNSQHPNISFTFETEDNSILPFLDIKIQRNSENFETSIYRKPTFTGLMSKFYDFAPLDYKANLITTLVCRAFKISSNYLAFNKEIDFLKSLLQSNGYPLTFIEKHVGQMLSKLYVPFGKESCDNFDVPKPIVYFTTYFLGNASKNMARDLRSIVGASYPQVNLRVLYKSNTTIGSNFSHKDKTPKETLSNLIYKYTCECCQAFYIGKTDLQFACRIANHMGVSARTGDKLGVKPASDIREHCLKCKVHVKVENFTILDRLYDRCGILILESLHQKNKKPTIGIQQQSTPLLSYD